MLDILDFVRMELEHMEKKDDPFYQRKLQTKFFHFKHNRLKKFIHRYIVKMIGDPEKMELVSKIADDQAFAGSDFHLQRFAYCSSIKNELFKLLRQRASIREIEQLLEGATFEQEFVLLTLIMYWEHFHGQTLLKEIMLEEGVGEAYEKHMSKLYKHFLDILDSEMIQSVEDLDKLEEEIVKDVALLDKLDLDEIRRLKKGL